VGSKVSDTMRKQSENSRGWETGLCSSESLGYGKKIEEGNCSKAEKN